MSKVTLQTIANLDNPNTAVAQLNNNFTLLQDIIDLLLSRDGTSPNTMTADLDMNANRILDLPSPTTSTEPARHGDIQQYVDEAQAAATTATTEAGIATSKATDVTTKWTDFLHRYVGAYSTAPSEDAASNPLGNGSLYFNTNLDTFNIYNQSALVSNDVPVVSNSVSVVVSRWVEYPQNTLRSMTDVSLADIEQGQGIIWDSGNSNFIPYDFSTYNLSVYIAGLTTNSETVFKLLSPYVFKLSAVTTDNKASARVAAASDTVYKLYRNTIQVGTVTFSATSTDGVFDITDTNTFDVGDEFKIVAPTSADTALADVAFSFTLRRS